MDWITTTTILDGLRDFRNDRAWLRLVDRFRVPIGRFAEQMGVSATAAEDVAQESLLAFATAYRSGQYDRTRGRLSAWLFGIAYRRALRQRDVEARGATVVGDRLLDALPCNEKSAADAWEQEWQAFVLGSCLDRAAREFEPRTMEVFRSLVRGQSATEVATRLGVATKTVYNAKHRVLRRMRELRAEIETA
jgi:RNA polymerase sigma factor (sigma-70 family)